MKEKLEITYYELILFWVAIVSALIVLMLSLSKFSPSVVLIGGIVILLLVVRFMNISPKVDKRLNIAVLIIMIIALLLRSGIITHYMGGQDQGLYVNMAATMIKSGSIDFSDRLRESLPEKMLDNYDSILEAGIGPIDDINNSKYTVDFYPMHSAWMSCSLFIFGIGKHTISLLFFSLLGLLGLYHLTMELTVNDRKAGYIALFLGSVNPVLVFFSKFPVGEMVALCFSINGFYFLCHAFNSNNKLLRRFFLLTSALLFSAFCYTRMTFPLLFPILLLVLCITFFFNKYSNLRKEISIYIGSLIVLFIFSWIFYYKFQFQLAQTMYKIAFKPIIDKLGIFALIGVFILIIVLFLVSTAKYKKLICNIIEKIIRWLEINSIFLFYGALAISIFTIIKLCKEGLNDYGNITIEPYLLIFRFHSLYRYILFISPVLLLVLLLIPIFKIKFKGSQILLILFLAITWLAILIQTPYILYLYYYGRYLVSEMVPYSIILFGIILSTLLNKPKYKVFSIICLFFAVVYFSFFSVIQMNKPESEDPYALYQIDKIVDRDDVIIYEKATPKLSTPLKLFFYKQVYIINEKKGMEIRNEEINYFFDNSTQNSKSKYGNIYLLEHEPLSIKLYKDSVTFCGKFQLNSGKLMSGYEYTTPIKGIAALKTLLLPLQYETEKIPVYLYRINKRIEFAGIPLDSFYIDFSEGGNSELFDFTGISDQEKTLRWTVGDKATISAQVFDTGMQISKCEVKITAGAYKGGKPKQRFGLEINGELLGWKDCTEGEYIFDIPLNLIEGVQKLTIGLLTPDAHSPSSVGESNDSRILGLRLNKIEFFVSYLND